MRPVDIYNTETFYVTSWGNGAAYAFGNKVECRSVFFQGDDAATFRAEIEAWENHNPDMEYETILANLWRDYSHLTRADEVEA